MKRFLNLAPGLNRATLAIILAAVAFYSIFIIRTAFVLDGETFFTLRDDAMISMRYAKNLAEGYGLIWNRGGEAVEGYTNFLWVLWMAVLHVLPLSPAKISLWVSLTGVVILIANALVVRSIALKLSDKWGGITAMLLTALYYPLIYWTLRGMEVGLLALLVNASLLHLLNWNSDRNPQSLYWLAFLLSLSILTRPDAIVPAAVLIFALWSVTQRQNTPASPLPTPPSPSIVPLIVLLTFLSHTLFRIWYYGDPLPNTYYLKVSGVTLAERAARGLSVLLPIFREHLIVPTVVAFYGLWRAREFACSVLWALFASACAYSVYVGGDAWEYFRFANRYVTVAMPALFILVGIAVSGLKKDLENFNAAGSHRAAQLLLTAVMLFVGLLSARVAADPMFFAWFRQAQGGLAIVVLLVVVLWVSMYWLGPARHRAASGAIAVLVVGAVFVGTNSSPILGQWIPRAGAAVQADNARARLGLLLERTTGPDVSIAVTAAGNIPYFANRHTEDFLGKVDPVVAHLEPRDKFLPGHDRWDYTYSVGRLRPDLIVNLWSPGQLEYLYFATLGYRDLFSLDTTITDDDAPCPGYMGAHGLACRCQDGSFFSGMTCDVLVRDGAEIDVPAIVRGWRTVREGGGRREE